MGSKASIHINLCKKELGSFLSTADGIVFCPAVLWE